MSANLYDADLREFESVAGRWPSPDPLGQAAVDPGDPQTLNRYAYAGNEPLERTDPSGGCFLCFGVSELGESFGAADLIPGFGRVIAFGQFVNWIFGGYAPPKPTIPKHAQVHEYSGVNPNGALQGEVDGVPAGVTLPQAVPFLPVPADNCDFGACGAGPSAFAGGGGDPTTQIKSLYQNIVEHLEKLAADPNNPAAQHWRAENWRRQILKKAGKRPGNLDKYLQRIIGISGSDLENILGSPIFIVNPCITNPLAPYCNKGPYNGPV